MMKKKQELRLLHKILSNRAKWYIDVIAPDNDQCIEIANKAKETADNLLSVMSFSTLHSKFKQWEKEPRIAPPDESIYESFLNDLAFRLGGIYLTEDDLAIYDDCVILTIKFLN